MLPLYIGMAAAQPNLVLISLDTTRADALSCYGRPPVQVHDRQPGKPVTPVLDGLAARGLRVQRFFAQSPSTLASHATMFTGRDPHQTLVVRNGYPLDPSLPTLAGRLSDAGYTTHAVIGAAALEHGSGIERGFGTYDDDAPELRGLMYQRRADAVVERALAVEAEGPLFLFVHFFDAHAPYEAPEPYGSRFVDPDYNGHYLDPMAKPRPLLDQPRGIDDAVVDGRYLGEVAWMDAQIGVLLDGLRRRGVLDDALVVVVGDHGEALSDDRGYAWTHGNDVSDGVTLVPLLMEAHGSVRLRRGTVRRTFAMSGLAPTIEALLGLEPTLGRGFDSALRPGPRRDDEGWPERPTEVVFLEATRPRHRESKTAWNNLPLQRRVVVGPHSHGSYPFEELTYPGPLSPLLAELLAEWDAAAPPRQRADMPPHTVRALKALGYLDGEEDR